MGARTVAVWALVCLRSSVAAAQVQTLTLADVMARARDQAPAVVSARLSLEEVRARLVGASLRLQDNPDVEASLGNRTAGDARFTDFDIGVAQRFEPGARRTARLAGANAAILQGTLTVEAVTRSVLHDAASAYLKALHAGERIELLVATQELAQRVYVIADRRYRAGDIAVLDVNLARATVARTKADREAAEAMRALALGELRQLLCLEPEIAVAGTLSRPAAGDLDSALQSASQRPELGAIAAAIQEAEAEVRAGLSQSRPEYGVGVRYVREEGDQIVRGGMTLSWPTFSKGQEQRAAGTARAARLRAELDAARRRMHVEVRSAYDAYTRRLAAVAILESDAIPGLDENEQLTTRSFEVGQIGLPELLLIRREILDTRSQYLDTLLAAALARVDLDASAGLLR